MVVQLSYRKSLRWVPGEPSEPTSTLVLDVGDFFVDLRILKATGDIDWAMAGKRTILSSSPRKCPPHRPRPLRPQRIIKSANFVPVKCQWTKEICSQNTEAHDDIGEFEDLPNGDALEKGSMPNPDNNDEIQAYEEVWGNLDIGSSDEPAWILRSKDGKGVTFVAKVGDWFQVLSKKQDGQFSVLREEKVKGEWVQRYAVGEKLPSIRELGEEVFSPKGWRQDTDVKVDGVTYAVYALEKA
ncbi:unnamed protein product [Aureobasidium uvarum]|uniref:Protein HRI1 n=1 Tax=Aureobasidium uvarum TaxID=2773716 RepID=A0A9N8PUT7_9PEZI|nr:unnamed protein product [Aureobasidium uvarum]